MMRLPRTADGVIGEGEDEDVNDGSERRAAGAQGAAQRPVRKPFR